jgi:phosphatidylglycerophosphate synthase
MTRPTAAEIRQQHQPTAEPPAWRWARLPSAYVTAWLYPTVVSPNAVSWIHLALLLASAVLMAVGTWPAEIAASLAIVLSYIADNVDGELARARGTASDYGKWLERTVHHYGERALILGAGLGGHASDAPLWWLIGPGAVIVFEIYVKLLRLNNNRRRNRVKPDASATPTSPEEGGTRGNLARMLLRSNWVFQLRPVSTNLWIVSGLFGVVFETLVLVTALRVLGAIGFLASHALLAMRGVRGARSA